MSPAIVRYENSIDPDGSMKDTEGCIDVTCFSFSTWSRMKCVCENDMFMRDQVENEKRVTS